LSAFEAPFERWIDTRHSAEDSVVLRYMDALRFEESEEQDGQFKQWLKKMSVQEGARIFPLLEYRGVEIHLMDETSRMHTGTLKSIDGCVSTAKCKTRGYEKVVFESGANTGTALTAYGAKAELETFFFLPEENLTLVDRRILASSKAHLISVDHPGFVKRAARLFGRISGARHIPETPWRYEASRFRGCFVLEHVLGHGRFDWLAQSISAAFGPIGIFKMLWKYERQAGKPPRFLGIQQEENCPIYRAWNNGSGTIKPVPVESTSRLLTKAMYDFAPHTYGTYEDLKGLLHQTRGDLTTINRREFDAFLGRRFCGKTMLEILRTNGIDIGPKVLETTGLMALAGTFKEIDKGTIPPGTKILSCLTSGISKSDGKTEPERRLTSGRIRQELSITQG
jgi:threonine synthase